jgi:hypothetical protein
MNGEMAIYNTIEEVAALVTIDVEFSEVMKTHIQGQLRYIESNT